MPVSILSILPKAIGGGNYSTSIQLNSVEVLASTSNSDLILKVWNASDGIETTNITYSGYTQPDADTLIFTAVTIPVTGKSSINLVTILRRKTSTVWVKEVSITSASTQSISLTSKVSGSPLSYYTYLNPDSGTVPAHTNNAWGGSSAVKYDYMQSVGLKIDANNLFVSMPDDGWSARWNLGIDSPNNSVTDLFTNGSMINYGLDTGNNPSLIVTANAAQVLNFIYSLTPVDTYNFKLYSQLNWATAKGCPYSDSEVFKKVLWYTARANLRTQSVSSQVSWIEPSWYWSVAQWMRDGFWTSMGLDDGDLCLSLFNTMKNIAVDWGTGAVCGAIQDTGNRWGIIMDDTPLHFLSWAYWLKRKFNITALTVSEVNFLSGVLVDNLNTFNRYRTWRAPGTNALNISFHDALGTGTNYNETAYNQGWLCVALRSAKEMGASVTDADIAKAKTAYLSFWRPSDAIPHIDTASIDGSPVLRLDSATLMGEAFYNCWFNESCLGTSVVSAQWSALQAGKVYNGFKCISNLDGSYITSGWGTAAGSAGTYQNGGVWLWLDFCCFYVAKFHGLQSTATLLSAWETRAATELAVNPVSHESLDTLSIDSRSHWGLGTSYNPVYGWNAAILTMLDSFYEGSVTTTSSTTQSGTTSSPTKHYRINPVTSGPVRLYLSGQKYFLNIGTGPLQLNTDAGIISIANSAVVTS